MASRLHVPGRRPLLLPGTDKRVLRRPNGGGLIIPQLSGAPLTANEVDYDELDILRQWREYSPDDPDQVRYFCYELEQLNPGAPSADHFFKAVRLIRLTRVPRYLRQSATTEQFRDLLAGLREKRVLFLNIIAKSPKLPLVFAYGVQGVGSTIEEATAAADEAYAALTFSLDGTYQQLEYQPLSVAEGELLARYQNEWRHIAMARGRPMPESAGIGASAVLDGNRTDVQSTNDAIASFVRGMGDKSFMLSMVTVPLTPEDMSHAWRNIAMKLSAVRSDQQGSRSIGASFSLPLGLGHAIADGTGSTHGVTGTSGVGTSDGLSESQTQGLSVSHSDGVSASHSQGVSASESVGVSASQSEGVSASESVSASDSTSASVTDSQTESASVGESISQGQSISASHGTTDSISVGQSTSLSDTRSFSESAGVSSGQSLGVTNSASSNWSQNVGQSLSAGQTLTDSWSQSFAESLSQTWGLSNSQSDGANQGASQGGSASLGGGLEGLGLSGTLGESWANSWGGNIGVTSGSSVSQTGGGSATAGIGSSLANSLTSGLSVGESAGGSLGQSITGTNSVGTSQSVTAGQSLGVTQGQSATQGTSVSSTMGVGSSLSQGASLSQGVSSGQSLSAAAGQTLSSGFGLGSSSTATVGTSQTATLGTSQTATQGVSATDTVGASASATQGASTGLSTQQAMSDAWMVALSRQASQTGSFGVVPGLNATISKATFDEAKRSLGDILEAQMKRYHDGIEGGAMLYQMFLVTEDRETLAGAASLLKAAFWGPGGADKGRLVQPFHTMMIDDDEEAERLLKHATALTHYRKREPVVDLIEPHVYSSYVTAGEAAVFSAPPTSEALGIMAQTDSMPVFAMPSDRMDREMYLGHIINGERGRVSDARFGVDLNDLTHILIQGITGMGKTSTMMRLLEQAVALRKQVTLPPTPTNPVVTSRESRAGVLCFDWMNNMRDLACIVEPDRFQLFSVSKPELGAFRWNPLEIPHPDMAAHQWLGAQADQLAASFGLGEVGRSLLAEFIDRLYMANRLEPFILREMKSDENGVILRTEIVLPPVNRADLPPDAIVFDDGGNEVANVYSCPLLSRLVSLEHVAVLVVSMVEELATPEGARAMGTSMRDRVQSVWRRIQSYAPGGPLAQMVAADPDLRTRECLGVRDIIDPDRGLVTVIETDGLDQGNRRVILGSVMLAVYRYGLHVGKGAFDNGGHGAGTFLVLEEAHELFGTADEGEDNDSVKMRAHLYESMFRRARATGLRLVAITQNCGAIPSAITSQTTTVIVHRSYEDADRKRICDLMSWDRGPLGQLREIRYLGEMPRGYALVRLDARDSYLESAPVHILVDPPAIAPAGDAFLHHLAETRAERLALPAR